MALQFTVDDLIQPIVSLSYLSSDEEMDVDDPSQATENEVDRDSDIEVLACYSEIRPFEQQATAGRFMTTDLTGCLTGCPHWLPDDLSIPEALYGPSSTESNHPPSDLIDLVLGQSPPLESVVPIDQRPIAQRSKLEPIPDTPESPPIQEQGTNGNAINNPLSDDQFPYWPDNAHLTGVAVRTSATCGKPNFFEHGDCYVCGRSFDTIREEITLNFLEQTDIDGELYHTRLRRRNALQAGMLAGSFIHIPRGVSQAAACDGNRYQVAPSDSNLPFIPGVLPL